MLLGTKPKQKGRKHIYISAHHLGHHQCNRTVTLHHLQSQRNLSGIFKKACRSPLSTGSIIPSSNLFFALIAHRSTCVCDKLLFSFYASVCDLYTVPFSCKKLLYRHPLHHATVALFPYQFRLPYSMFSTSLYKSSHQLPALVPRLEILMPHVIQHIHGRCSLRSSSHQKCKNVPHFVLNQLQILSIDFVWHTPTVFQVVGKRRKEQFLI